MNSANHKSSSNRLPGNSATQSDPRRRSNKTQTATYPAFEIDNAKQLTVEQTAQLFVPTPSFERLLTRKNHIILGARGSGKTTWARMLAHDHLIKMVSKERYAKRALEQHLIGVYVPTSVSFVGSLKTKPWQTEEQAEWYFQWRMNLQSCAAFLPVFQSCLEYYEPDRYKRHLAELEISREMSRQWGSDQPYTTFEGLRRLLELLEEKYMHTAAAQRAEFPVPEIKIDTFQTELFYPFKTAARTITRTLGIPNTATWMVCLDEAEYLTVPHHRILNTHLRTSAGELFFKIATMPFAHHTLETNTSQPVRERHDFHYISIDQDPIDPARPGDPENTGSTGEYLKFARKAFVKRATYHLGSGNLPTLQQILGESSLLDEKAVDSPEKEDAFFRLLEKHATRQTIDRARKLRGSKSFRSAVLRKIHGALLLKEAISNLGGNSRLDVYAGETMLVRCSDGNARRLVNLFALILEAVEEHQMALRQSHKHSERNVSTSSPLISARKQTEILEKFSKEAFMSLQSEPPVGKQLFEILQLVANRLSARISKELISTDLVSSIEVKEIDGPLIQSAVRQAVQLSMLVPAESIVLSNPQQACDGIFHLGYVMAPYFQLLPRQGKSVRLLQLLSATDVAGLYGQRGLTL